MGQRQQLRDKLELSLDNRQVFLLFCVSAVILSLVFAFGVTVGKKLRATAPSEPQTDPLALLDTAAAAGQHGDEADAIALTFPKALGTSPARAGKDESTGSKQPQQAADESNAKDDTEGQHAERAAGHHAKPKAGPRQRTATGSRDKTASAARAHRSARAKREEKGGASGDDPSPRVEAANGAFTLQLSSFQDRSEADQFVAKLRTRGYAPKLVRAEIPGRGTWYRVRVGRYIDWDSALQAKQRIESQVKVIAYVARR